MRAARRWIAVAAVNLLVLVLLLLAAEGVARWLCHDEFEALFRRPETRRPGPFVVEHPVRGLALVPGFEDELYRVDSAGFRGPELPADLERRFVIVALGDSTTFGWGVAEGEDYPARLQALLGPDVPAGLYVVNAGVPGYTSGQTLLYLREILAGGPRTDLLLVSVLWNDIWFSTVFDWQPHLLVHGPPPAWRRWLTRSSLYRCVLISRAGRSDVMNVFNQRAFDAYVANVEAMFAAAREKRVPVLFVAPPFDAAHMLERGLNSFHITYTRDFFVEVSGKHLAAVARLGERYGVPIVHHRLSLGRYSSDRVDLDNREMYDLFLDVLHPNAAGNDLIARDVAAFLRQGRYLPGEPRIPPSGP